jgi:excisionase family DNA binding protein
MSAISDEIAAAVREAVGELPAALERLSAEVKAMREALPPMLVSLKEAAKRLGVSEKTARRRVKDGTWPSRRDGGRVLVDLAAIRPLSEDEIARAANDAQRLRALPGGKRDGTP